jgi:cytochrome c
MGPALKEVAKKYANRSDAANYLAGKIKSGGAGVWGSIPMPPMNISDAESKKIAQWLSQGSVD